MEELYSELGLKPGASKDILKKTFRELSMKYHPDKNKEEGAEKKYKKIKDAYEILTNQEKMNKYKMDKQRKTVIKYRTEKKVERKTEGDMDILNFLFFGGKREKEEEMKKKKEREDRERKEMERKKRIAHNERLKKERAEKEKTDLKGKKVRILGSNKIGRINRRMVNDKGEKTDDYGIIILGNYSEVVVNIKDFVKQESIRIEGFKGKNRNLNGMKGFIIDVVRYGSKLSYKVQLDNTETCNIPKKNAILLPGTYVKYTDKDISSVDDEDFGRYTMKGNIVCYDDVTEKYAVLTEDKKTVKIDYINILV